MNPPETSKVRIVPSIGESSGSRTVPLMKKKFALVLSMMAAASMAHATDISWIGPTASYNTPADWSPATVPTGTNNAIVANGLGNKVQINPGDPDWTLNDLEVAGVTDSSGAVEQKRGNPHLHRLVSHRGRHEWHWRLHAERRNDQCEWRTYFPVRRSEHHGHVEHQRGHNQ